MLTRALGYHFMSRVLMSQTRPLQRPPSCSPGGHRGAQPERRPQRPGWLQPHRGPADHLRQLESRPRQQGPVHSRCSSAGTSSHHAIAPSPMPPRAAQPPDAGPPVACGLRRGEHGAVPAGAHPHCPGKCRQVSLWCSRTTGRRWTPGEAVTLQADPHLPLGRGHAEPPGRFKPPVLWQLAGRAQERQRGCISPSLRQRGAAHVLGCQTRLQLAEGRPIWPRARCCSRPAHASLIQRNWQAERPPWPSTVQARTTVRPAGPRAGHGPADSAHHGQRNAHSPAPRLG